MRFKVWPLRFIKIFWLDTAKIGKLFLLCKIVSKMGTRIFEAVLICSSFNATRQHSWPASKIIQQRQPEFLPPIHISCLRRHHPS